MQRRINSMVGLLVCLVSLSGGASLTSAAQAENPSVWERVYRSLFGGQEPPVPPRAGGSRGGEVCVISPGKWSTEEVALWQQRPLLVWRGGVKQVSIGLKDSDKLIWQQDIAKRASADQITHMVYPGPSLQPGETYRMKLIRTDGVEIASFVRVLDVADRGAIAKDWRKIQDQAWANGERGEALVQKRMQFLTEQKLWLDIVHEVFRSGNMTADWQQLRQGIVEETCDKKQK